MNVSQTTPRRLGLFGGAVFLALLAAALLNLFRVHSAPPEPLLTWDDMADPSMTFGLARDLRILGIPHRIQLQDDVAPRWRTPVAECRLFALEDAFRVAKGVEAARGSAEWTYTIRTPDRTRAYHIDGGLVAIEACRDILTYRDWQFRAHHKDEILGTMSFFIADGTSNGPPGVVFEVHWNVDAVEAFLNSPLRN